MMIHRVDERSQQTKFHILRPYKKMALMPTFYSTLSTIAFIFFIFYCVTLLGGFHPGSRGAYAVPMCLCRYRRWSSYRLSRTDFPPRIPETEQIAERPDKFQKMIWLKGQKWQLPRSLFTGVAMRRLSVCSRWVAVFCSKNNPSYVQTAMLLLGGNQLNAFHLRFCENQKNEKDCRIKLAWQQQVKLICFYEHLLINLS